MFSAKKHICTWKCGIYFIIYTNEKFWNDFFMRERRGYSKVTRTDNVQIRHCRVQRISRNVSYPGQFGESESFWRDGHGWGCSCFKEKSAGDQREGTLYELQIIQKKNLTCNGQYVCIRRRMFFKIFITADDHVTTVGWWMWPSTTANVSW